MKIKSVLIIIAILLFAGANGYSQRFSYGVKGGVILPGFAGGNSANPTFNSNSIRPGASYGIYGEYHISTILSVSLGLEYSPQGGLNKFQAYPLPASWIENGFGPNLYSNFKADTRLNYIVLPLLARYSWKINSKYRFYAGVGPSFNFLLNAKGITSSTGTIYQDKDKKLIYVPSDPSFLSSLDPNKEIHATNIGANGIVGLGYTLNRKDAIFIELGGQYGVVPIQGQAINGKSHAYAFTAMIGYAYTFKDWHKNRYHKVFKSDIYK